MSNTNNRSLSHAILAYLAETSKDLAKLGVSIAIEPYEFLPGGKYSLTPRMRKNRIATMKRTKYFNKEHSSPSYLLSSQGRVEAIKLRIAEKHKNVQQKWDGCWRIVTYDVAELSRRKRDFLRHQLKNLRFVELQKSVWITPISLEDELYALLELWNVEIRKGDVRIILAKKITKDNDLKKQFHLIL